MKRERQIAILRQLAASKGLRILEIKDCGSEQTVGLCLRELVRDGLVTATPVSGNHSTSQHRPSRYKISDYGRAMLERNG